MGRVRKTLDLIDVPSTSKISIGWWNNVARLIGSARDTIAVFSARSMDFERGGLKFGGEWDDLRFPASGFRTGGVGNPGIEAGTGMLLYSKTTTETIFALAQLPHSWLEGSTIKPHIHWTPTTAGAGNVLWRVAYQVRNAIGAAAFDFSAGWTTIDSLDAAAGVDSEAQIASFAGIDMTGITMSALVHFKVSRIGGDGTDTYDADARLLEFDFHYQTDRPGSRQEHVK